MPRRPDTSADPTAFPPVVEALSALLEPYRGRLRVGSRRGEPIALFGAPTATYPDGMFFAGVRAGKSYVGLHLMPVYLNPALLHGMSAQLERRMQGKSCFNFRTVDRSLLDELRDLVGRSYREFERLGYAPVTAARS